MPSLDICSEAHVDHEKGSLPGAVFKGDCDNDEEYSYSEQRKIVHKIDRRLITGLGLLFAISLVDRTNLGNALIAGMGKDLQLQVGTRYSVILLVFFAPYVVFQMPFTVVIHKIGPRNFLSGITLLWGVCFGFVHDWRVLIGLRMILGVLEAGLFPGAVYLLSMWYSRFDIHKRYSCFYLISVVGSAFSGLLAFGFIQMGGVAHLAAWRWIFIMEGLLTCGVAFAGFLLLVDFPSEAHKSWKFLTEREIAFVIRRLNRDRQDADEEPFNLKRFFQPSLDPKVFAFAFIFFCATVVSYAIVFFLPLILTSSLGFSVAASQCLATPPYFFAGILMYAEGWIGDKYRIRGPIIVYNSLQAIVGLTLLCWTHIPGIQYFGIFLVASGTNATIPAVLAYQANNIRGHWKRAFCSATLISFGGIGGIVGSLVFRSQDAPRYLPGLYASIICNALSIVVVGMLSLHFFVANKRATKGELIIESLEGFRYTL